MKTLITLILFISFMKVSAQNLKTYEPFIRDNFSELLNEFPHLDFDNFVIETSSEIENDDFPPFEIDDWNLYLQNSEEFILYNPSKTFAVDYNSYGDVDQETDLLEIGTRNKTRIHFCGSSCAFNDGKWVNDYILILSGGQIDYDSYDELTKSYRVYAMIMLVDLANKINTIYLDKEDFINNITAIKSSNYIINQNLY
ncbi:hypothetical protein [Flavobacterium sp. I3-2]|uniref:hypothetical protein n=1 Tax=Flavobacterium sp. I3-2 TaxID=2748319 RepID=UPI0015B148DF|nr:hypothetical protein [Flavobacterium sp. I3-2]